LAAELHQTEMFGFARAYRILAGRGMAGAIPISHRICAGHDAARGGVAVRQP
jgi:hypothetical protein